MIYELGAIELQRTLVVVMIITFRIYSAFYLRIKRHTLLLN